MKCPRCGTVVDGTDMTLPPRETPSSIYRNVKCPSLTCGYEFMGMVI